MAYTVSVHNGSQVRQAHNLRIKEVVEKEAHIKADGEHITIFHRDLKEAYKSIFGEALDEYNERVKKKNPDRVRTMKQYLNELFAKMNKTKNSIKPCYEMILQVGNLENSPNSEITQLVLEDFFTMFKKTFPQLEVIGFYIHNDEDGSMHAHLDYIPVANSSRGMKKQPLINSALEQMGYKSESINYTAQMQFQDDCRELMRSICKVYDLEIEETKSEHKEHIETETYKLNAKFEELAHNYNGIKQDLKEALSKIERYEAFFNRYDDVMLPLIEQEARAELLKLRNKKLDEVQID